jgi:hypothetical protein
MEYKFRPLRADEIDCRVSTISEKWLSLLLYKDARVDMDILDETVGAENWERDHKELKGNIYCGIGIWDEKKQRFIYKWDAGKESFSDSEKGEASDSFKRAGFNWGIGRELYTAPFIGIKPLDDKEIYKNKNGKLATNTKFKVSKINYDKNKNIIGLEIIDNKKNVRFKGGRLDEDNK